MSYESKYRPCHSIWSNADVEALKKAVLSVDPAATFEDGNVGYSYPYGQEDLLFMITNLTESSDECNDTKQETQSILQGKPIDIRDISSRMRDYDRNGYIDGITKNVEEILRVCLTQYLKEYSEDNIDY